ncbi:MAG: PQQ-binding-like beta-propeller repeat protein [Armatimonadota bacterium]
MSRRWWRISLAAGSLALVCCAPAHAQEWTRFRGPNGSGISKATTVPVQFTPADYNWKVKLPGIGHSSPVLWGKKLFLASAEQETGTRHLHCLDAATGKIAWTYSQPYPMYGLHMYNNAASGSPAVDGERVYFIWGTPDAFKVHALDHSGKPLWTRDLGRYKAQHGAGSSPILVGDIVIVAKEPEAENGLLVGLDAKTGEVRWQYERFSKDAPYATPVVYRPEGGPAEVIFTNGAHGMTSLNPANGKLNWELRDLYRARNVSSPIVLENGLILAGSGNGGGDKQTFAVKPGSGAGKTAPQIAYEVKRGIAYVPTPIAIGNRVFIWGDAGIVHCINADTGETVWMERVGGNFFGSPVCVNGKLYAINAQGEVVVIAASDELQVLGRSELGEASHSTPAVADGVMYLRTESHLISVGGRKK